MRVLSGVAFILCVVAPVFAADPAANTESPALQHARLEVTKIEGLVATGVLPRARLEEARSSLADAQDGEAIRSALYEKDITVPQADELVRLTQRRVERRQLAADERNKLLAEGIIARSEAADAQNALDQANRDHTWAVTRAQFAREMVEIATNEQEIMRQMELANSSHASSGLIEHFVGTNRFDMAQFPSIERAFEARFARALPVSAMGETEVHKTLGFDHRNRVDIALQPDQPEGQWLRNYLTAHNIPYFAFRTAVAHKATGAHIHIGPPSLRYLAQAARSPSHAVAGED